MPRILLLHVSVGMGHQRAAVALAHAFAQMPATTVQVEDTLDYAHGWFRRDYAGAPSQASGQACSTRPLRSAIMAATCDMHY